MDNVESSRLTPESRGELDSVSYIAPPGPFSFTTESLQASLGLGIGSRPQRYLMTALTKAIGEIRNYSFNPTIIVRWYAYVRIHNEQYAESHKRLLFIAFSKAPRS